MIGVAIILLLVGCVMLLEAIHDFRYRRAKHRYGNSVFYHKRQTQCERPGSIEYFKRAMGRADEIED